MEYRIEKKYIVSDADIMLLQSELSQCMQIDSNQQGKAYQIRSLYFDDYDNSCFYENEDSVPDREKFRIRIYDNSANVIKLEEKSKHFEYTKKRMTSLTQEDCILYMKGQLPDLKSEDDYLIKKLYAKMQSTLLRPVIIVEYERTALVESIGNVRITFDRNIGGSRNVESFFSPDIEMIPLLERGQHIMEVKYDEFLPDYIRRILMSVSLNRISFSKYYYARNNEILN